jgi:hypothetical protein
LRENYGDFGRKRRLKSDITGALLRQAASQFRRKIERDRKNGHDFAATFLSEDSPSGTLLDHDGFGSKSIQAAHVIDSNSLDYNVIANRCTFFGIMHQVTPSFFCKLDDDVVY